jgi:hypothetical protein
MVESTVDETSVRPRSAAATAYGGEAVDYLRYPSPSVLGRGCGKKESLPGKGFPRNDIRREEHFPPVLQRVTLRAFAEAKGDSRATNTPQGGQQ